MIWTGIKIHLTSSLFEEGVGNPFLSDDIHECVLICVPEFNTCNAVNVKLCTGSMCADFSSETKAAKPQSKHAPLQVEQV